MAASRAVAALALLLLVPSCDLGGDPQPPAPGRSPLPSPTGSGTRIIGLVGSVSGPDSWRGEDAIEGADLAVGLLNRSLGPAERRFELFTLDDESDPALALRHVRRLAALDRTVGLLYAGPAEVLPRAEPSLAAAGIPALALYGDLYGARRLRPHLFQVGPSYLWQARRIAAYLLTDRGYGRLGVLVEEGFEGDTALRAVREALRPHAGDLSTLLVERYAGPEAVAGALGRLRAGRAEALVVQAPPGSFAAVLEALDEIGATFRSREAARLPRARKQRRRYDEADWSPQVAGFDTALSPLVEGPPVGTVAAETYARGAHYLPVPSLRAFRADFLNWWDELPLGFERRAYEAARALGWAAERTPAGADVAAELEGLRGRRWGGLDLTLGPDDHTFVAAATVGLWVVPGRPVPEQTELPEGLPWAPLSRGFSIDGETTDLLPQDWRYLIAGSPPQKAPAPDLSRLRFGIATGRKDPIH